MSMLDRRSWRPRDGTRTMKTLDQVVANGPHSTGARYSSTKFVCMCQVHSHEQEPLAFPRSFVEKMVGCCVQIRSNEKATNGDVSEPPGRRFGPRESCLTSTNPYAQIWSNEKTTNGDEIESLGRRSESRNLHLTSNLCLTSTNFFTYSLTSPTSSCSTS